MFTFFFYPEHFILQCGFWCEYVNEIAVWFFFSELFDDLDQLQEEWLADGEWIFDII